MLVPRARSNLSHRANGEGAGPRRPHALIVQTRGVARRRRSALTRICRPIHLSNSPARSRGAFFAPGVCLLLRAPGMRGGRSAERTSGACEAPVRRVRTRQALVRRLASLVRGTLASRRSTVAILGSGPALPSPDLRPDRSQRAPRIRVIVPGGRGPRASRGERLPAGRRGTPLLAPSSRRCSRRHPSGARMDVDVASARYAVKRKLYEMCCCSKNVRKDYWRQ